MSLTQQIRCAGEDSEYSDAKGALTSYYRHPNLNMLDSIAEKLIGNRS
jgi:hypothetical protein